MPSRAEETGPDDLSSLTAAELYRRAQAAGIRGRATMTKAQLIEALHAANP
ncbi:MAG TPA: Rho termination factor N-terminal domain-containing protein [Gaiellaceae bacterium]|nr:Rho termination factor N-terminal domain-containing protein [Gaiellaceae bacterium]